MIKPDTNIAKTFEKKTSADIINAIRNDPLTSTALREATEPVKYGDINTLRSFGDVLNAYTELQNDFANALMGRIALTLIKSKAFANPYRAFKRGILEMGEIIQDIYVDIVRPHMYNPGQAEKTWMKRELPSILAQYYNINSKAYYKMTISTTDLSKAFVNWNGVTDLVARLVGRLMDSMQIDEFMLTKYTISRYILEGRFAVATVSGNPEDDISVIKGVSNAILFPSTNYNPAGVLQYTQIDEQYLFIGSQYSARFDVEVLAKAFNMDKTSFLGHQVLFDNLADYDSSRMRELLPDYKEFSEEEKEVLNTVVAVLIDMDAFMIFDNLLEARQAENGEGLYWQHWLHSWKTINMSPFSNQIVFIPEASRGTITALEITPGQINGVRGKSVFFTAKAISEGIVSGAVSWTVDSDVSVIGSDGQLMISVNEPKTELVVTATSKANKQISATARVSLKAL